MRPVKHLKIDFSTLSNWKLCGRRFELESLKGRSPSSNTQAMDWGTVLHSGLGEWHLGNSVYELLNWDKVEQELKFLCEPENPPLADSPCGHTKALNKVKQKAAELKLPTEMENQAFKRYSLQHALRAMFAYMKFYKSPTNGFRLLQTKLVEQTFSMPLTPWLTFEGTLDLLASNGRNLLVEHKTMGSFRLFPERAQLTDQATGYIGLAQHHGISVDQVLFNAIKSAWSKSDRTLVRDPVKNFQRIEVHRSPWQVSEWKEQVIQDCEILRAQIESQKFTTDKPQGCLAYFKLCPFSTLCNLPPENRGEFLETFERTKPWPSFEVTYEEK